MLEMFEVGPCESSYELGFQIGRRFSDVIGIRLSKDLILQNQLLPWARTEESRPLIEALTRSNRDKFPGYWDELIGTAEGSGAPLLEIMLINFRKEILSFLPVPEAITAASNAAIECSDVLVVDESVAVVAHNEDASVALLGHTYLIKGTLPNQICFVAYTYAGELPSCAFGFNNCGMAFTLNSVPPSKDEIMFGGVGRNFISRDLLEAKSMNDALDKIHSSEVSVGHSYNLIDVRSRKILNVETASRSRLSIHEVGRNPFFHANMYLHLQVPQVHDENSITRQKRAATLPKRSKEDFLSVLGDTEDAKYPIFMTGPTLYTLCTALMDLDQQTMSIIQGNPKNGEISHIFSMLTKELEIIH
ncbi:uncharacterized protein LOC116212106 isoform X2 [Punica granatum]|uniref:Uncharacterized protein LOC116212106 isoform X2 n=1 Tax=Punica granatum TaxID=22663 RepID=A0A6P8DYC2_PUNGR|nr:uncharacterized protein LOC116212106 isoform X2 [Punica granatum]